MENNHQYTAKEENSKTPKNIRQMGITEAGKAVYVEDYVVTFLNKLCKEDKSAMQAAILLGTFQRTGNRQPYVGGAVGITDYVCGDNRIHFTETKWMEILEEIKQNFPGLEIVGWFIAAQGFDKSLEDRLLTIHKEQFREPESILFYVDTVENEEKILRNENGVLKSQGGYYIYYEKNRAMQEYMVHYFGERTEETKAQVPDKAARQFRRMVQEKETKKVKKSSGMSYAFATFGLLVIFAVGMSVLDNYEKLSYMEKKVESLTSQVSAISDTSVYTQNSTSPSDSTMATDVGDSSKENVDDNGIGIETSVVGIDGQSGLTAEGEDMKVSLDNLEMPDGNSSQQEVTESEQPEDATEETWQEHTGDSAEKILQENTGDITEGKQSYIVEQGDTLQIISVKMYQTTDKVDEIMELNHIENADKILVGEKIWLP